MIKILETRPYKTETYTPRSSGRLLPLITYSLLKTVSIQGLVPEAAEAHKQQPGYTIGRNGRHVGHVAPTAKAGTCSPGGVTNHNAPLVGCKQTYKQSNKAATHYYLCGRSWCNLHLVFNLYQRVPVTLHNVSPFWPDSVNYKQF